MNLQKWVGTLITNLTEQELTHHVGREKYKRKEGQTDYRNGGCITAFDLPIGISDPGLYAHRAHWAQVRGTASFPGLRQSSPAHCP